MRSVAPSPVSRLVGQAAFRLSRRSGHISQLARSAAAISAHVLALGWPLLSAFGATSGQSLTGCLRHLSAMIEPDADAFDLHIGDLMPPDPDLALEIYAGTFTLAGRTVASHGRSIFDQTSPGDAFTRELHAFGWLRHLREADSPLALINARALIADWIDLKEKSAVPRIALDPEVAAIRFQSFLANAGWLLHRAGPNFRQQLLGQATRDFQLLRSSIGPDGVPRIRIAAALLAGTIVIPAFRRFQPVAARQLDLELRRQILPDGGHISRSPSAIVEILTAILPLKPAFTEVGTPASTTLMTAIDRMRPMLRFFSLAHGSLARFNGATAISPGLIETILVSEEAQGRAHGNAPHSGYQRLDANDTVVIMDCGIAPPPPFAARAHAGTLSFEFASPANRFVINCGTEANARHEWRAVARETAAHSTIVVDDRSSATSIETGMIARLLGAPLLGGPRDVRVDRREHGGATAVIASHDGYAQAYGLIHERTIRLSPSGDRIDGRDLLIAGDKDADAAIGYVARFHLDPAIRPVMMDNGVVMLLADDGEAWEFHAADQVPTLEDSIYLADPNGPIPTRQIVLSGALPHQAEQRWMFMRTRRPPTQTSH